MPGPGLPAVVLFDLDGTLSDSAPGIIAALAHAFAVNGLPPLDEAVGRSMLGPPFAESFPALLGGEERVPEVIASYREHYGTGGMFNATVYAGIPELLGGLQHAGVRMAVATSKLEEYAVPVVEHLRLAGYFETVCGDLRDSSRGSKALVIAEVLRRIGDPDPAQVLMVGDRRHDVVGARAHGIRCAGAAWGYGPADELAQAGANPICATPGSLAAHLGVDVATAVCQVGW
jgi:phosphoglycolate phosphatase